MMTSSEGTTVTVMMNNLLKAWNAHDLDQVAELYHPNFEGIDVAEASPQQGLEGVRQSMQHYFQAFPDLQFAAETLLIQEPQVSMFWVATGTHQGKLMNIPPTGRTIQVRGASLFTVSEGKIKKVTHIWDVAGLLRGIGLLPEL
jgi:steroid delta-isomerase-like uncharacterized protein